MQFDIAKQNGVAATAAPGAARYWQGLRSSQDFGRIVEEDFIGDARFERRPIYAAAGFNH